MVGPLANGRVTLGYSTLNQPWRGVAFVPLIGYSGPDGDPDNVRVAIDSYLHLVEDCEALIKLVRSGAKTLAETEATGNANLGLSSAVASRLPEVPYFVSGQSMGGAVAFLVGIRAQDAGDDAMAGVAFLAPALGIAGRPGQAVEWILKNVVCGLVPRWHMPSFLDATTELSDIWVSDKIIETYASDPLSFKKSARWCTAVSVINMADATLARMADVAYPFLILHDPEDKITSFEHSERLFNTAATSTGKKVLHRMTKQKHDLVSNSGPAVAEAVSKWISTLVQ